MDSRITHDAGGICVKVFYGKRSITLRLIDGRLQKTATSGGYIPKPDFARMVKYGREIHTAHHCIYCPETPPLDEGRSTTHFRKEDGSIPNPRHWADRDDDD
ncbi:MAG: hypothetical protein UY31_C0014G0004 [Candidatus Wolfebacteria bacterium GW2011_GWE1_48_7]|nr:MAG: hypothetical protein UX96_C0033G0009 [Candidatus Wolfebacteria bacterium GW2011_GWB1_47_243]KKU74228.1 MAG: hypothetical protein UY00_C0071G0004 [Candidatus Wolfebacteria bacterium GW2011_GWA1_47_6]KKU99949.1 MAG: hypothetical protein UY31_C0014G0004 [Candidatus Wolfebacteria bacterium GW2011_GWE1_48_7]HAS95395.1 hypothetical protein [Candidatus Wolfebacteria bacterium]HBD18176.1 hypothetical protein [Candidatus Wolfebacteria bacterium]